MSEGPSVQPPPLRFLTQYFLRLGTTGFGGPVALVGYMHRDLVEVRRWIDEAEYKLALALAQIMPGPLAAQTAMAIGFFRHGLMGATLAGVAFVLPSFLMVVALAIAYVHFGGLWWVQAAFYGIAAAVIAIIAIGAYRLSTKTNRSDPLLWGIAVALFAATIYFQAELAALFIAAGLLVLFVRAPPKRVSAWWHRRTMPAFVPLPLIALILAVPAGGVLLTLFLFFAKAGAFVFGSGLAIVPFLHAGVVTEYHWLDERTFLDAVAVAIITPGPVVITVAFIGYLVAGPLGSLAAAIGMFLPVWIFTVLPAPWFRRHQHNPQLKAFVDGATAAATGAIAGAVVILGHGAITDGPTIVIGLVALATLLLWRRLPEPLVVLAAGTVGLAIFVVRAHGWPI